MERPNNSRLKLLAYKLLTQVIILIGAIRDKIMIGQYEQVVSGRTFDIMFKEQWTCCDCGAVHNGKHFEPEERCEHETPTWGTGPIVGHMWPVRPVGYDYTWRFGAQPAALAQDKDI